MTEIVTKNYKAGEVIYNINDPADKIYLIHNGKVRIKSKLGLNLGILVEGEMFGENSDHSALPNNNIDDGYANGEDIDSHIEDVMDHDEN